jgi:NADH dehydrogenase
VRRPDGNCEQFFNNVRKSPITFIRVEFGGFIWQAPPLMGKERPHIVVLGAGFAGLTFCQTFPGDAARITLVDRHNHHLFQPLLYQVATAGLSATEIAQPIRSILTEHENVVVYMDDVLDIQLAERKVVCSKGDLHYDYLIIALGGVTSYFGHPEWEPFAPGLKSLDDALQIRRNVLTAFEQAETESDPEVRRRLMTIVVVGGGPTGVELAGAFAELSRTVLNDDFHNIDPTKTRVVLVEGGPRILSHLPESLSQSGCRQLEALGVEVRTKCKVKSLGEHEVLIDTGTGEEIIEAGNIVWAAGVGACPLTRKLGAEIDRAGRIMVSPDLSIPGHPEVFAIGDIAHVKDADGRLVPGVSPAAIQMAQSVARNIHSELAMGSRIRRTRFVYRDKGSMATIGRSAAVAKIGNLEFSGMLAWIAWLLIHLLFLIGFRSKAAVLLQWTYSYFTYKRGARIVFGSDSRDKTK